MALAELGIGREAQAAKPFSLVGLVKDTVSVFNSTRVRPDGAPNTARHAIRDVVQSHEDPEKLFQDLFTAMLFDQSKVPSKRVLKIVKTEYYSSILVWKKTVQAKKHAREDFLKRVNERLLSALVYARVPRLAIETQERIQEIDPEWGQF